MRAAVLGSGSGGNSTVLEADENRVLLDAGFSCKEIERRLRTLGVRPSSLQAIILTHEHSDHCRGAEVLARRYDLPIYGTRGTLEGCRFSDPRALRLVPIVADCRFEVGSICVCPFAVPHDAREPVGLVVEASGSCRLGLVADLGSPSRSAMARLEGLDILIQETNHDLDMLRRGPYPWALKQRVAGDRGHLSNEQASEMIRAVVGDALRWVVLYHLSETNNLPALAAACVAEELDRVGSSAALLVAQQSEPSTWLEV